MQWPYPLSPSSTAPNFLTNIPDLPLSFLLLFCQPRMCQTARYIWSGLPHQPSFLPSSTIFYHFFFFKVLSVYLTFQAVSSRCSFKESRLVLTKFKGKNGCLKYPIHNFWLILTHFSVISDLKNSQNLHFHQFSPDLFKGGGAPKNCSGLFLSFWHI